jgi:hypothetical protein
MWYEIDRVLLKALFLPKMGIKLFGVCELSIAQLVGLFMVELEHAHPNLSTRFSWIHSF